jgi:hypothetical protein
MRESETHATAAIGSGAVIGLILWVLSFRSNVVWLNPRTSSLSGLVSAWPALASLATLSLAVATMLLVWQNHQIRRETRRPHLGINTTSVAQAQLPAIMEAASGPDIVLENAGPGIAFDVVVEIYGVSQGEWMSRGEPLEYNILDTLSDKRVHRFGAVAINPGRENRMLLYSDNTPRRSPDLDQTQIQDYAILRLESYCRDSGGKRIPCVRDYVWDRNGPPKGPRKSDWVALPPMEYWEGRTSGRI